ncbi:multiheme c-type cytochrome, partial [uncultured Thiocystis sp.]|uniref:multiheme c-type cytochrome n=1 Tax=uncultured Thiocystis sp. TaxID=1202134 RepID=UPI0025E20ADE
AIIAFAEQLPPATYAGSQSCATCHPVETERWRGSDHARAMTAATEATVRGDFNDGITSIRMSAWTTAIGCTGPAATRTGTISARSAIPPT